MSALEFYERQLRKGSISRREFMGRAMALGVALPVAASMAARVARAAAPKKGGFMRVGLGHGSTTDSLDPGTYTDSYMMFTGFGFRNCLTEVSNTDELIPELAESWDVSDDAATWTFKIRKGVEFHNGKTLDADDVMASLRHHLAEDTTSPAKAILKSVTEFRKDDKHTVTLTLESGNADFAALLSDYHIPMMPANADGMPDWQSGAGTGGYIVENFNPGVRTKLKRNPNYWKEGYAHADEVETLVMHDTSARTNALSTDAVDVIDRVDLSTAHLLGRREGVRIIEAEGTLHYVYSMLVDTPPYDNVDVRLALKYALNREELLEKLLFGHGYIGNDHPIGKSNRYYAADLPQRPYDPDKAKFHLKKAGLSSLKVSLSAADAAFAGSVDGATLYREHAAAAGIEIEVVREPNDGYWSNVWGVKPWVASYWSGRVTEDWMFSTAYEAGVPWNETHWANPRFNELLKAARTELDDEKRRQMYYEMQQLCSDDGGVVVPIFSNYVFAVNDKVNIGENMSAAWDLDGVKGMERWWMS